MLLFCILPHLYLIKNAHSQYLFYPRFRDLEEINIYYRQSFQRKHSELQQKINNLEAEIQDLDSESKIDISLIEEVLALTRNIHQTYQEAPTYLKRHYLRFFFEKIFIKDKKITKVTYTPIFSALKKHEAVIIRGLRLERWYVFRRTDWATELEYPEFTNKEINKFLTFKS